MNRNEEASIDKNERVMRHHAVQSHNGAEEDAASSVTGLLMEIARWEKAMSFLLLATLD